MSGVRLCALDDLDENDSAAFSADIEGVNTALMVIRQLENVYAYVNSCPHIGTPLDFMPGQFLTLEKDLILCSTHGALFRIEDGECVHGPCIGKHLKPLACSVHDGDVWLD